MLVTILSLGAVISATLCIRGKYSDSDLLVYVSKPATTTLLLGVAFASGAMQTTYGQLVVLAIVFSLAGDVFLMLPKDRFIHGLSSFLIAHLVLIVAFAMQGTAVTWWLVLPIGLVGLAMYAALASNLGRMKLPVALYIAVIGVMAWFALERWNLQGTPSATLAAVGSLFFLFSDSTLALNRFRSRFRSAEFLVLTTYWLSIWLTAMSVTPGWL